MQSSTHFTTRAATPDSHSWDPRLPLYLLCQLPVHSHWSIPTEQNNQFEISLNFSFATFREANYFRDLSRPSISLSRKWCSTTPLHKQYIEVFFVAQIKNQFWQNWKPKEVEVTLSNTQGEMLIPDHVFTSQHGKWTAKGTFVASPRKTGKSGNIWCCDMQKNWERKAKHTVITQQHVQILSNQLDVTMIWT